MAMWHGIGIRLGLALGLAQGLALGLALSRLAWTGAGVGRLGAAGLNSVFTLAYPGPSLGLGRLAQA